MTSWQPFSEFQAFRAHGEAAPLPPPPLPSDALAPPAMSPIPIESRTERLAVWSLVLSLLSLVFCGLILGIPGVICGHLALSKIRKTPDLQGGGLAISGVIVGYVAIALWLIYLVILLGLGISKIGNPTGFAKQTAVRADVQAIGTQLQLYDSMNGFYPTTEQGLQALVTQPSTDPQPTRWYQLFKQVPKDPWGSDYIYRCPGQKHPDTYDLYSGGPDRRADTGDDDWGE